MQCVGETIKNEAKEQKSGFLGILLGTLGASLLRSLLAGKEVIRGGDRVIRAGEGVIRCGYGLTQAFKGVIRAVQDF